MMKHQNTLLTIGSSIAKGGPAQACAHLTHINCLPKSLVCPVTEMKRLINTLMKQSNAIMPNQLIQPGYATYYRYDVQR